MLRTLVIEYASLGHFEADGEQPPYLAAVMGILLNERVVLDMDEDRNDEQNERLSKVRRAMEILGLEQLFSDVLARLKDSGNPRD